MIEKGKIVSVHYTGRLTDGEIFDSSEGREPLKFQVGSGQIITGFEEAIIGKNVGDKIVVNISSEEAYGQVREDLIVKVSPEQMPGKVEIGQSLEAQAENGQSVNVIVTEVTDDYVIIDGNHPLAGEDLQFDIEIIKID